MKHCFRYLCAFIYVHAFFARPDGAIMVGMFDTVHSLFPSESNKETLLTIWEPNEEQLNPVEGTAIQFENLSVKSAKHEGLLQLTATGRTPFEQYCVDDETLHQRIGFTKCQFLNYAQSSCGLASRPM
jgi:hypothetical protein